MSIASTPTTPAGSLTGLTATVVAVLRGLLERAGFWTAVLVPLVAVGLLMVRPDGWLAMAAGLFALDGLAVVVGHCHGMDC